MKLKLKKVHPKKQFRLGRHVITHIAKEFELNEAEEKELKNKGCQAWVMKVKKNEKLSAVEKKKLEKEKKKEAAAEKKRLAEEEKNK